MPWRAGGGAVCAARNSSPPCSAFPFSAGRLAAFVQQEVSLPGGRGSVASHMLAQGMLNVFIWKGFIKCISKARVSEQLFNIYIIFFLLAIAGRHLQQNLLL